MQKRWKLWYVFLSSVKIFAGGFCFPVSSRLEDQIKSAIVLARKGSAKGISAPLTKSDTEAEIHRQWCCLKNAFSLLNSVSWHLAFPGYLKITIWFNHILYIVIGAIY